MDGIPRIKRVKALKDMIIDVEFENGVIKKYDIKKIVEKFPAFAKLKNEELFNLVEVDTGGFGVVWNEEIDLSEYEIWNNGIE